MSATNRGSPRQENDSYPTPAFCVRRLLEEWPKPVPTSMRLLEPCAGSGGIVRVMDEWSRAHGWRATWDAVELDRKHERGLMQSVNTGTVRFGDFLRDAFPFEYRNDAAIMNPPFDLAEEFVRACLARCDQVAVLLRLGFLASEQRWELMRERTPDVFVLPNRPRFDPSIRRDKTGKLKRSTADSADYAWMVFPGDRLAGRTTGAIKVLRTTPSEERASEFARACAVWDSKHPEIAAEFAQQHNGIAVSP